MQHGKPCMWVLLDTERRTVPRKFFVVMTGQPLPDGSIGARFVGMCQLQSDSIVIHLFEEP